MILLCGACASHAGPLGQRLEGWGWNTFRLRSIAIDRSDKAGEQPMPRAGEHRKDQYSVFPESSGSSGGNGQDNSTTASEGNRRPNRSMSPEERRALRRQIDEAGHDIYTPKR
ncbi:hypothetical protein [Noviherbaspirillum galbum]|uniref:Uncharacterized protein n=1 Tax=Noviherbaspirillum galbum TaxID=2709383 RepID=A0A6B3SG20_9BURK|nr:hypothetical protein [Noviherbaspirillum galbum]NEX59794.1 hypothetical protein [Noviherbaspirillum galbum]